MAGGKVTVSDLVSPEVAERFTGMTMAELAAAMAETEVWAESSTNWQTLYQQACARAEAAEDERDRIIAEHQHATERYRLSLNETLNRFIATELDAGNDERAAALRSLRAWNRGAGYVVPGARP